MASLTQAVRKCLMGVDNFKISTASMESRTAKVLTALFCAEKKDQVFEETIHPMLSRTGSRWARQ
jgi:hypothetical protein